MKPIIMDMKDMSDSTEIYEEKSNPAIIYSIYIFLGIIVIAITWMYFFKIDIVKKGTGIFRKTERIYDVSCETSGKIKEIYISEGKYVKKGDVLFTIDDSSLENMIVENKLVLSDISERLLILQKYRDIIDDDNESLDGLKDNKYYTEFYNRNNLLKTNLDMLDNDIKESSNNNIDEIKTIINDYQKQKDKLLEACSCIESKNNTFSEANKTLYTLVKSYIEKYKQIELEFDSKIKNKKTDDIKENSEGNKENNTKQLNIQYNDKSLEIEKNKTLQNLEEEQLRIIRQQIENIENTLSVSKSNLLVLEGQANNNQNDNKEDNKKILIMTEKANIDKEILEYTNKKIEYESILDNYNEQKEKLTIVADGYGYITMKEIIKQGSYIQEGTQVCQIIPDKTNDFYVELYIMNEDIAKVKKGQNVKIESLSYSANEYGFFSGKIESISKDITTDYNAGRSYYIVKVKCNGDTIVGKDGKKVRILNGMSCKGRIIVDGKRVITYLLEKINLWN